MIDYHFAKPKEYADYLQFANMVFSASTHTFGFDYATLIPKVYAPDADMAHIQAIAHDDVRGIVGLVACLPCDMQVQEQKLKTGYIGTVSVHPDARGEGHMKRLMAMQLEQMRTSGCDVAFLGGLRQRYEYFGFVPGGLRWLIEVSRANVKHALRDTPIDGISFIEIPSGSELEIQAAALHRQSPVHFDRKKGFRLTCASYHGYLYACLDKSKMIGYLVTNTAGTEIRELMTLDADRTDQLLKAWMVQHECSDLSLELADWRQTELRHLSTWAEDISLHHSEQVRILHYRPVLQAMLTFKASYTSLEDGDVAFEAEGQAFTIHVKDQIVTVTEDAIDPIHLDCLTAGRLFTSTFLMDGLPRTPRGWFPLPFYVSEPDKF